MRAVVRDRYGDESRIEIRDVPVPRCAAHEVTVRVSRASVGPDVWHILTGLPLMARLAFGLRVPREPGLGSDFAGVIEHVGDAVTGFAPGQRVVGSCTAAFAETVCVDAARLSHIPTGVTDTQAAALPTSGATAVAALAKVDVVAGTRVLVIGAAGGIGHLLVQLATGRGGRVTGVCRPEAADDVTAVGAIGTIDYTTTTIGDADGEWDVIIDTAGRRSISLLRNSLTARGRIIVIGGEGGGRFTGGFGRELLAAPAAALARQRVRGVIATSSAEVTDQLLAQVDSGELHPWVHAEVPFERAAEAIESLRAGHLRGKIVLTFPTASDE